MTQPHTEDLSIQIRSKNRIEVVDTRTGTVVGKAHRGEPGRDWYVGALISNGHIGRGIMQITGTVGATLPEVDQRRVVLATLKTLFGIGQEDNENQ